MAQDHGIFDDIVSNRPVDPVMHVTTADAREFDIDLDIVRVLEGRYGSVLEFEAACFFEDEGEILRQSHVVNGHHDGGVHIWT